MAKIKASTLLRHPETDEIVFLAEGANAPAWSERLITNPAVLTQPEPEPEPEPEGDDGEGGEGGEGGGEKGQDEEDSGKETPVPRTPAAKTAPKK